MAKMTSALSGKSVGQIYAKHTSILRLSMCLAGDSVVSSRSGCEIGLWELAGSSFRRSKHKMYTHDDQVQRKSVICDLKYYIINLN